MSRDFSLPPVQATATGYLNLADDCRILYERRLAPRSVVVVARFGAELIISQPRRQMKWQCADIVRGGHGRQHIRRPSNYINNYIIL